jgi:rhamnulokinase
LGIDAWGVDHGFLEGGRLIAPLTAYRDRSHEAEFLAAAEQRTWLYQRTGIQHQPFNTVYQLLARKKQTPHLVDNRWLLLPDLFGALIGGGENVEATMASTTQLVGWDGEWDAEIFRWIGWPVPDLQPAPPGGFGGEVARGVQLVHVGSHDTASAVAGLGTLTDRDLFLNVGTWTLAGKVSATPCSDLVGAEVAGLTHERTVDGRYRILANIPGFYVINRLHEELCIPQSVPEWLSTASFDSAEDTIDLMRPEFFNPPSMVEACLGQLRRAPTSPADWAGTVLLSLAEAVKGQIAHHERLTGHTTSRIRIAGGGSQSRELCQALADRTACPVVAGPVEATVAGNLAIQFLAQGVFPNFASMSEFLDRSTETVTYLPGGGA